MDRSSAIKLSDAYAVLYVYNTSILVQTELDGSPFGNGEIASNPYPETRGQHGPSAPALQPVHIAATHRLRYKVQGGYWPAAPNPFVVVGGAWTNDL